MFDQISLRAMCAYEKLTGKNAMELFNKDNKSATDLRDLAFLIKATKDKNTTLEDIENLSGEEFESLIKSMTSKPAA
jgi:hypothetical protein